jgi:DNA polymerase III epsilon subunit-like protein
MHPLATAVNNITDEQLVNAPDLRSVWQSFMRWLGNLPATPGVPAERTTVLMAYNGIKFDFPVLDFDLRRPSCRQAIPSQWSFADLFPHVREVWPRISQAKLVEVYKHVFPDTAFPGDAHSALGDTQALAHLYAKSVADRTWDLPIHGRTHWEAAMEAAHAATLRQGAFGRASTI